jgi:hypothetical protein
MLRFGIIGEGITDQNVIEQILLGYFEDQADELEVNYIQPPLDTTGSTSHPAPGGWSLVLDSLRQGKHEKALQTNDYLIIQIDTDVSEQKGYDVPWKDQDGNALSPDVLIDRVVDMLVELIGAELYAAHSERFLFAIAVHEIECWLLPLFFDTQARKAAKITGCLETINRELRKRDERPLSTHKGKELKRYRQKARAYARRKKLMAAYGKNPSFKRFVDQLAVQQPATSDQRPAPEA